MPLPHDLPVDFPAQMNVTRLEIQVKNTNDPPDGFVHLWEVSFK
jgi:hypothetical protein